MLHGLISQVSRFQGLAKVLYEMRRVLLCKREQKQIQGFLRTCTEKTRCGGKIGLAQKIDDCQNAVIECGQDLRDLAEGKAASVLTKGDIASPVATILDVPMVTNQSEKL